MRDLLIAQPFNFSQHKNFTIRHRQCRDRPLQEICIGFRDQDGFRCCSFRATNHFDTRLLEEALVIRLDQATGMPRRNAVERAV